jgi:hypothetical protein
MMAEGEVERAEDLVEGLFEQWAGEAVELAATVGVHDTEGILEMFSDPALQGAVAALRVSRGEGMSAPLTETFQDGLRAFAQRVREKPAGAVSWLDLRVSQKGGGQNQ